MTAWRNLLRGLLVGVGAASLLAVGGAAPARAQSAGGEGRIYVSAFLRLEVPVDGSQYTRQVITVDPETGACEALVKDGLAPRVSFDGRDIAFWMFGSPPDENTAHVAGLKEATFKRLGNGNPLWLGDNRHLLLVHQELSPQTGQWQATTWRVARNGSEPVKLDLASDLFVKDCSRDGELLLVARGTRHDLYTMRPDGSQVTQVTSDGRNFNARFSPDGRRIAYVHSGNATVAATVNVADVDGKNAQVVYQPEGLTAPRDLCWSPDGAHLAICVFDWLLNEQGQKIRIAAADSNSRFIIVKADGTVPRELKPQGVHAVELDGVDWK